MYEVLNLTQHNASKSQLAVGVFDPTPNDHVKVRAILTFEDLPMVDEIDYRAYELTRLAKEICEETDCDTVMIGGAPFLMGLLAVELINNGLKPVYAFSKRVSSEHVDDDGNVVKYATFKHLGFIPG